MSSESEFLMTYNNELRGRCEHHVSSKNRQCKNRACYVVTGCVFEHKNGTYCYQHANAVKSRDEACRAKGTAFIERLKTKHIESINPIIDSTYRIARSAGEIPSYVAEKNKQGLLAMVRHYQGWSKLSDEESE